MQSTALFDFVFLHFFGVNKYFVSRNPTKRDFLASRRVNGVTNPLLIYPHANPKRPFNILSLTPDNLTFQRVTLRPTLGVKRQTGLSGTTVFDIIYSTHSNVSGS